MALLTMRLNLIGSDRCFLMERRYPMVAEPQLVWLKSVDRVDIFPVALLRVLIISLEAFFAL